MLDGSIVCRLVKKKKGLKITKGITIWTNPLGWCKARTDKGIDKWFKSMNELQAYIEERLLKNYEIDGPLIMPERVVSYYQIYTEEI